MSWYFEFIAENKEAAKAEVRKRQAESGGHYPADVADFTCAMIDRQGHMPGYEAISLKTQGHLPASDQQATDSGYCKIEITNMAVIKASSVSVAEAA